MKPRVISLFSGVGTFDYGFHLAGWETVYLCEWDAKAREVLSARFPGVPLTNDVRDINGADLPDAELIMFGSPCQDLSVAGKRAGLAGEKSSLFLEAIRIIREKREATNNEFPRFALWENVPGAFSSNSGRDFAAVLTALAGGEVGIPSDGWPDAGVAFGSTAQVAWRLLDSQHFGVPQRRRRIFALADFAGECAGAVLFESEGMSGHPEQGRAPRETATRNAGQGTERDSRTDVRAEPVAANLFGGNKRLDRPEGGFYVEIPAEQSKTLDVSGLNPSANQGGTLAFGWASDVALPACSLQNTTIGRSEKAGPQGAGWNEEICFTLGTMDAHGVAQPIAFDFKASVQRDPMCGPISPTLEAQDKAAINTPDYRVRRLTPVECERLQSMPDNWSDVDGMADSHRYRFMGNGGTSLVLKWLAERIRVWL